MTFCDVVKINFSLGKTTFCKNERNDAENLIKPVFPRLAKRNCHASSLGNLTVSRKPSNLGKSMVCCNLSVVRGTQSPECIEYTTFGSRLNPLKPLEILAFLAAPACRATEMPAEAVVPRAKSHGFLKPFKNLGKSTFPGDLEKGKGKK